MTSKKFFLTSNITELCSLMTSVMSDYRIVRGLKLSLIIIYYLKKHK